MLKTLFAIALVLSCAQLQGQSYLYTGGSNLVGKWIYILEDTSNTLTPEEAYHSPHFVKSVKSVQNFDISNSTYWIKISVANESHNQLLFLEVANPLLDTCNFYKIEEGNIVQQAAYGMAKPFLERKYKYPNFLFNIDPEIGKTNEYLFKIRSTEQMVIPILIENNVAMTHSQNRNYLITGAFIGLIIVMVVYNFFIFMSTSDKSYLYYITYLIFIGLTQITLSGYTFELLFRDNPKAFNQSVVLFPSLAGVSAILFIRSFMNIRIDFKVWDKVFISIAAVYIIAAILRVSGKDQISSRMIDICALTASVTVYAFLIVSSLKGSRPGKFLFFAWTIFLFGLIIFVLRNFNILPYNDFTTYILQTGIAAQVAILSIALADKINILQAETRSSQKLALLASQENERIVKEQNIILEREVNLRTKELQEANVSLEKTLVDLKEAEMQLVESEKMSSLGQLTAGIAHEINNPINFVTSNVKPLRRDIEVIKELFGKVEDLAINGESKEAIQQQIDALKEEADFDYLSMEMDHLIKGIAEGASRTAEIVKGLRIFSRLDEDDLKLANLNEGLDSTLVIVNNLLNGIITVEKDYAEVPMVECFPGKLNQVFLNIITNAIHTIKEKWGEDAGGKLTIKTYFDNLDVTISIKDNGMGMTEETQKKLYEPFYTTKEVGVGTGLGLSIAWNTIKKHNGSILVRSELGEGSEFLLTIPIKYTEPQND